MVFGRGRLGRSLARALRAPLIPGRSGEAGHEAPLGDDPLVFLAVPDPAVATLAAELAGRTDLAGAPAFAHVSGALQLTALAPLRERGYAVGAFHPLQSFPVERDPSAFRGSLVAIDASAEDLLDELSRLAEGLGARPRRVTDDQRLLYHAAAVMASNYLVALAAQSSAILQHTGWERQEALEALVPLMRGMVDNLERDGLPGALIGPIRRGDAATVERQVQALEPLGELSAGVYRVLGRAALALAREAGLEEAQAVLIEAALNDL